MKIDAIFFTKSRPTAPTTQIDTALKVLCLHFVYPFVVTS